MHWVGEALVYLCVCLCVQWLVFRCGNTPGPFNEIPAVEESRVHVACGIPASLSLSLLSSTTSSPSSPSSIPLFSHHYSCTQPQYPCGLVSNGHFILSFSRFAPSCCYVLSQTLLWITHFPLFPSPAQTSLFSFSFFHFLTLQVFLSFCFTPTPTPELRLSPSLFSLLSFAMQLCEICRVKCYGSFHSNRMHGPSMCVCFLSWHRCSRNQVFDQCQTLAINIPSVIY